MSKESSIRVAVRVRPFTRDEERNLVVQTDSRLFAGDGSLSSSDSGSGGGGGGSTGNGTTSRLNSYLPHGIRKVVNVVDENMLIFDPPETNPLNLMREKAFPNNGSPGSGAPSGRVREHRFVFDQLFDTSTDQYRVYEQTTRPLLDSILEGYNSTVFAYGATGCGKTHTISGSPDQPGVIMLTMQELFAKIDDLSDTKQIDVNLSYLEIYNETIRDLLAPETSFKKLLIREDSTSKISISNLSTHTPTSVEHVMELIMFGNANRTSSPTEANAASSRSHAVLQINVSQKSKKMIDLSENQIFATLSIIDLAGSERAAATKNRGVRLHEGANINKSLLALGNCINALCDPKRHNHIPYRDSKLTRLLKFSLGGNCKTVMIVCISPSSQHYDETLNTLKYANRAKEIKTKIIRNQHNLDRHVGSYLKMITEQREEIEIMRGRENSIKEEAERKEKEKCSNCIKLTLEYVENFKASLSKHTSDKWKKYHLLAKRKILLLQKVEAEAWMAASDPEADVFLLEQIVKKCGAQVAELENQYSMPNDNLDLIFNESVAHSLKKLQEEERWTDYNTKLFQELVSSVRESLEKEILFNSSILFDYLIHNLPTISLRNDSLESLVNGEFDSLIEEYTSNFMRQKIGPNDSEIIPHGGRESRSKRDSRSRSPLKYSPPTKKQVAHSPTVPTFIPSLSKKVRWQADDEAEASDSSMDEYANTTILEDHGVNAPAGGELDISFNPTIDSPPTRKDGQVNKNSILSELKQALNTTRAPTHIPIKSFINQQQENISAKKVPLLNKDGAKSSKLQSELNEPAFKLKLNSIGSPTKLLNGNLEGLEDGLNNAGSSGSDKVD